MNYVNGKYELYIYIYIYIKLVILTLNPSVCISIASMEQSVFNREYFFSQQNEK